MSLSSVCGRMAGILSPLVTLLGVYHYSIPLLVYGIVPIVAGGFCLLLPETVNVELQDHAEVKWVTFFAQIVQQKYEYSDKYW